MSVFAKRLFLFRNIKNISLSRSFQDLCVGEKNYFIVGTYKNRIVGMAVKEPGWSQRCAYLHFRVLRSFSPLISVIRLENSGSEKALLNGAPTLLSFRGLDRVPSPENLVTFQSSEATKGRYGR